MSVGGTIGLRPVLGSLEAKRNEPRFLFVTYYDPKGINTICEHIALWQRQSRYDLCNLNLYPGPLALPQNIDLDDFDGLIIHPTVSYMPDNIAGIDRRLGSRLDQFDGVKVLVKQDEQVKTGMISKALLEKKFDILVTCVPPNELAKAYAPDVIDKLDIVHALTGYVSDHLKTLQPPTHADRQIDIAYRGSVQPLEFGRLGFEKRWIGYEVARATADRSLVTDISSHRNDIIAGNAWFDFLGNAKAVLGVESGSNLFDFDGTVAARCRDYEKTYGPAAPDDRQFYLDAHDRLLSAYEGNVDYAQISPRHFEAAATRSVQILYEGRYSDIFVAGKHFLPLKRDLSNLWDCLDTIQDQSRAKMLAEAAYEDIILNEDYSYSAFIRAVDQSLSSCLAAKASVRKRRSMPLSKSEASVRPPSGTTTGGHQKARALMVMGHDPILDPRIEWMASGLEDCGYQVVELGTFRTEGQSEPSLEKISDNRMRLKVERRRHDWPVLQTPWALGEKGGVADRTIHSYGEYMNLDSDVLARKIGAYGITDAQIEAFRSQCDYFFHTNNAMLETARKIGTFDIVIAVDLDCLPVALVLADEYSAFCCYDAHEYWPAAYTKLAWEHEFWAHIEGNLAREADLCLTVSAPLAEQMSAEYGKDFLCVPNCETLARGKAIGAPATPEDKDTRDSTIFLFQGNFAPCRPVHFLIDHWHRTDPNAILWLRGPDWSYKNELIKRAKATGLLDRRIFFPPPVAEHELIDAARQADVGVIPYDPSENMNYDYACPNKFSQYMAAGLPILASSIKFVKKTVEEQQLGMTFDTRAPDTLVAAVNAMTSDKAFLTSCGARSQQYFFEHFNWEVASRPFHAAIKQFLQERTDGGDRQRTDLQFSWIKPRPRKPKVAPDASPKIQRQRRLLDISKPIIKDVLPPMLTRLIIASRNRLTRRSNAITIPR